MKLEIRNAIELRSPSPGRLEGYAAVFGATSRDLGGFTESIRRGAFARSLAKPENISALFDHDRRSLLGRVESGTLELKEDSRGLWFGVDLPATTAGNDLAVLVERGDVAGASFAFRTLKDEWDMTGSIPHRQLLDVELHEITITADPAYPDTEVAKRSMPQQVEVRIAAALRFLETC